MTKKLVCASAALVLAAGYAASLPQFTITTDMRAALNRVSADSLRGNLSFIASDLLEGRNTPSRGLEIASEYIAAQFRRAGLEPAGDDGYFQTAKMSVRAANPDGFELKLSRGDTEFSAVAKDVDIDAATKLDLSKAPVVKAEDTALEAITPTQLNGKIVIAAMSRGIMRKLRETKPALLILIQPGGITGRGPTSHLLDPSQPAQSSTPRIVLHGEAAQQFYHSLPTGSTGALASVHLAEPSGKPVQLRNIIGILRGSDPVLKDTFVLVSAHYDHLGEKPNGEGDRIYNGANDDGSGTVSVIELANALSSLKERPRRSIVFMTFFGEEEGLIGSQYYTHHPIFPIDKTVADVNLEQVGRTDSTEGPQIATVSVTGFDYSNLSSYLEAAGELTGIRVYKNKRASDLFFAASDNLPLAKAGVPAHSLCVAFEFSDYHGVGDEWNKIDYDNMAKVDRMVALALIMVGDSAEGPHWDESNAKAAPYVKAWKSHHSP